MSKLGLLLVLGAAATCTGFMLAPIKTGVAPRAQPLRMVEESETMMRLKAALAVCVRTACCWNAMVHAPGP